MKRVLAWLALLVLMVIAFAPLAGQATRDSVVCTACVLDSTITRDSVPVIDTVAWAQTTTITWFKRDSIAKVPVAPVPLGHEPAGFRVLADVEWTGLTATGPAVNGRVGPWLRYYAGNHGWSMIDSSAPGSPWVLEVRTPQGGPQGSGFEHLSLALPAGMTKLYLRWGLFVPVAYVAPAGNQVQKLFHLWGTYDKGATGSIAVPSLYGPGLTAQLRFQNVAVTSAQAISFNRSCIAVPRGRWVVLETLLDIRAGLATLWVDGRACGPWPVTFTTKAGASWQTVSLNPTYGGTGQVPANAWIRFGRVRVSAAP